MAKYTQEKWKKWVRKWAAKNHDHPDIHRGYEYLSARTTIGGIHLWECSACESSGTNFAHTTLTKHMASDRHIKMLNAKEKSQTLDQLFKRMKRDESASNTEDFDGENATPDNDSVLGDLCKERIKDLSDESLVFLSKLFVCVFYLASNSKPFSDFPEICKLMGLTKSGEFSNEKYQSVDAFKKILNVISQYLEKLQVDTCKKSDFWGMIVDGSTDKTLAKRLIIYLMYFKSINKIVGNGVFEKQVKFYKLIPLKNGGTAQDIYNDLKTEFDNKGFDWKKFMGGSTDNENTMVGARGGLTTLLKTLSGLAMFHGCLCHLSHLGFNVTRENEFCVRMRKLYGVCQQFFKFETRRRELDEQGKLFETELAASQDSTKVKSMAPLNTTRWTSEGGEIQKFGKGTWYVCFDTVVKLLQSHFGGIEEREKLNLMEGEFSTFSVICTLFFCQDIAAMHYKLSKSLQQLHSDVLLFREKILGFLNELKTLKLKYISREKVIEYEQNSVFGQLYAKHIYVSSNGRYKLIYNKNGVLVERYLEKASAHRIEEFVDAMNELVDELHDELSCRFKTFLEKKLFQCFELFLPKSIFKHCISTEALNVFLSARVDTLCVFGNEKVDVTEEGVVRQVSRFSLLGMNEGSLRSECKNAVHLVSQSAETRSYYVDFTAFELLHYLNQLGFYANYVKMGLYCWLTEVKNDSAERGFKKLKELVTYKRLQLGDVAIDQQMRLGLVGFSQEEFIEKHLRKCLLKYLDEGSLQVVSLNKDVEAYSKKNRMKILFPFAIQTHLIKRMHQGQVKLWLCDKTFKPNFDSLKNKNLKKKTKKRSIK